MRGLPGRPGAAVPFNCGFWFGLALAVACVGGPPARAQQTPSGQAQPFQTIAPYALVMDYDTRTVLLEKSADELMVPASTAKLMTAEVVFHELAEKRLKLDDEFLISENAWRRGGAAAGGSTMFAALNSKVRVEDLLRGLIIDSGNDAAIAFAEGLAGSEEAFATVMNKRASELGLTRSTFTNPWGRGDPGQRVTAREMANLAAHIIETYPEYYKIFGEREFTWNKVKQQNRNPLLLLDIGADGLKTGNIDESGFALVASALQGGQRVIVVINGLKTANDRKEEGRKLIQWALRSFEAKVLFNADDTIGYAKVYGGASFNVPLTAFGPVKVLIPRGSSERLSARIVYQGPLLAPVEAGKQVARLQISRGKLQALDIPLKAQANVGIGPLWRRALDAALELGYDLIRKSFSKS
jgi:serine-type D-Ala-D-Ala carboxypeptidase (penicillin-binding protein 5/6)